MILWLISLREIRAHRGRTILTAASLVIGVAAVVAVNLASVAVRASFGAVQATIAGGAALEVLPAGDSLFEEAVADRLAKIDGVKAALPIFERPTVMYFGADRRVKLVLLGVDPKRDEAARDYGLAAGRKLSDGDEAVADSAFAAGLGLNVDDEVRLLTSRGRKKLQLVGLLKPLTGAVVGRGSVLFAPLATVQESFKAPGRINKVQLVLADGADRNQVQSAVAKNLPPGLTVRSAVSQSQMGEETMLSLQLALQYATAFALMAAVFIVGNAFFMNVTQRQRQLAVMRAIGATRSQVWNLILREALVLATLGAVLGIAVGWAGAVLLSYAMEQLFRTNLPTPHLAPVGIGLALAFGLGVSFLGAVLPAWRAAKVEPVEGMREVSRGDVEGAPQWFIALGGIGFVVFGSLLAANVFVWKSVANNPLIAIAFLVCAVPLIPLVLESLARAASFAFRIFGRPETRIARQQLLRRRVRTTLTIGVLFIAASTGLALASTVLDNIRDIRNWYETVSAGDFFIRALTPDLATWVSAQIPEEAEAEVRQTPGLQSVFSVRFVNADVRRPGAADWLRVILAVRDFPSDDTIQPGLVDMSPAEIRRRLLAGEVTVGSVLSERLGLKVGDEIEIQTNAGPQERKIAAVINDYMGGGLVLHMDRGAAAQSVGVQGADAVVVRAIAEQKPQVEAAMRRIAEKHGLLFQSYTELTGEIDTMLAGVIGGLWVVMILGMVVASLGVMNTLTMNVLEQSRELAMLRVVAMTRRQARRTVLAQAAILGSIGLIPGIGSGLALAWLMNRAWTQATGHDVAFGFHPWLGVIGLAVAMALVVLAALLPAQRAASLEPIQALRYE